jgi:glyoxylase-like metal-dependent hydrolase (beta-lactamase superfamily II)
MRAEESVNPDVTAFFDEATYTVSYLLRDPGGRGAAVVDPVLDYDPGSGRTNTRSADRIAGHVRANDLTVEWILETHVHADHLSAGAYLKSRLGGRVGIGEHVGAVQATFKKVFNTEPGFRADGSQFDRLFKDGESFAIGGLQARVLHTPGHTPACVSYAIGDAAFVGDTLFMPDYGTARTDFPGGDAATLYRSVQKIFALPPQTRLFTCHDYKAPGRDRYAWETTVAAQRDGNVHIRQGVSEADFVRMRRERDKTLSMPALIIPAVQVNIRGGHLPPPEDNGVSYLKIPVNTL